MSCKQDTRTNLTLGHIFISKRTIVEALSSAQPSPTNTNVQETTGSANLDRSSGEKGAAI